MLRDLVDSGQALVRWLDTTTIPVWCVFAGASAYFMWAFWRDLQELRRMDTQQD